MKFLKLILAILRYFFFLTGVFFLSISFVFPDLAKDAPALQAIGFFLLAITLTLMRRAYYKSKNKREVTRKSSAQPTIQEKSKLSPAQDPLSMLPVVPDKAIEDSERLELLSCYYNVLKLIAAQNLEIIKVRNNGKQFQIFPTDNLTSLASYANDNKKFTFLFGDLDQKLTFKASVTAKILNLHSNINYVNDIIKRGNVHPWNSLIKPLQLILMDSFFLEETFRYGAKKAAFIHGDLKVMIEQKPELKAFFDEYVASYKGKLKTTIQSIVDPQYLGEQLKTYHFSDFHWMCRDVTDTGRVVYSYLLPSEIFKGLTEDLRLRIRKLKASDFSMLEACLAGSEDNQIGTIRGSDNEVFWSKLKNMGFAREMDPSLPPHNKIDAVAYSLTKEGRSALTEIIRDATTPM